MEHTSLYRKYRPQTFTDVIGQDHITKLLTASIKNDTVAHAYIFAGSRGTGKTSVARIFARELGTDANDLYEIDAASNTGVDDVRALNDSVYVLPFSSTYKIYLLDEAHMLSKAAFNALLKTIEEPPAHVIFILATTETEKLPETIISRCQLLQFNKPNRETLAKRVLDVVKKEGAEISRPVAELVALIGDGSFRDTLGVLQKVLSAYPDGKLRVEDVETITGAPRTSLVNEFLAAFDHKDVERGLKAISEASDNQVSMELLLRMTLEKIRAVLLARLAPLMAEEVLSAYSEEDNVLLKNIAHNKASGITSKTIVSLLEAAHALRFAPVPELPLELAVMSMGEK